MIIPVRCFTCNKMLADKWDWYVRKCEEMENKVDKSHNKNLDDMKYFTEPFKKEILDELGLNRYCCRRHMLGHVDIIDKL